MLHKKNVNESLMLPIVYMFNICLTIRINPKNNLTIENYDSL